MLTVKVAVGVDHLWLYPDAKVHAQCVHAIDDRLKAVGKLLLVHVPVAETCVVILALAEPSVIDDEAFYSELAGFFRQGQLAFFADIEFRRFPGVIEDGAQASALSTGENVDALEAMQRARCLT